MTYSTTFLNTTITIRYHFHYHSVPFHYFTLVHHIFTITSTNISIKKKKKSEWWASTYSHLLNLLYKCQQPFISEKTSGKISFFVYLLGSLSLNIYHCWKIYNHFNLFDIYRKYFLDISIVTNVVLTSHKNFTLEILCGIQHSKKVIPAGLDRYVFLDLV